ILTTHVGSLIRPSELVELGKAAHGGSSSQTSEHAEASRRYHDALERATADVVRRQVAAGVDIVNDGEYGKSSWANYVLERMSGFELRPGKKHPMFWLGRDRERFKEAVENEFRGMLGTIQEQVCKGAIHYSTDSVRRDIDNLKAALAGTNVVEAFVTAVAPASAVFNGVDEFYGNEREYI